ncbi:ankyrin [Colletotrichum chrysophilum]|uniref:Ankyrin n=1 Tax=Colletotrichum chrysophilum TaxID=1836956 RepID=A0AAD9ATU0_9PEZI|nr:ankyrin [Colletotrichum chrysophilum]
MLYTKHAQKGTRPTPKQLSEVFKRLFSSYHNIFIVIDALDECASSDPAALELVSALQALGSNVRLLITSRTSTNFESFFKDAVRIDVVANDEDVRLYLERNVPTHSRLARHIRADPKLQDDIVTSIAQSAQGMFLLAALNLDFLSRKLTRRDVRSSLSILPKTLDATYEQALERIRTQAEEDVELAETIILWILCARRPLDVHELQHMYAIHLLTRDEGPNAEAILLEDDDLPPEDIITGVCGSFIVVDSTSKTVRLVHYTAQDYLNRTFGGHLHEPRMELTRISLEYLQLLNFEEGPALSDSVMVERLANFPFLDYAAKYWGAELQALQIEEIWEPVNRFLSNDVAVSVASQTWSLPRQRYAYWSNEFPKGVPAIVLASSFQMPNGLERVVGKGNDIEGHGSDKETALIRSARLGHEDNITALLQLGADVAATDIAGETAIDVATIAGKASAVKALIDGGANWQYRDCAAADRLRS